MVSMDRGSAGTSHSGQAQREPESRLDSRPGLLPAGVTFFRGNDERKEGGCGAGGLQEEEMTDNESFFDRALSLKSRLVLLLAALILLPVYFFPLWNMTFRSNQYTDGLVLHIYAFELQGGKTPNRDDLREINSLNHYIGMRPLLESDFSEFVWLPFAIGALMLLTLRALVIGKMANVIDVFVLFSYFGLFSLWSFYHRLYMYGHNLDPTAAIKVQPFTPPLF